MAMKSFKKILALLLALSLLFAFAACGAKDNDEEESRETETTSDEREVKTEVAALFDPTGLGLVKLKNDRAYGYNVNYYTDPAEVASLIKQGKVDIASLPLELAAGLYAETSGGIQILAVNSLCYFHVLERGKNSVNSVSDLKGKTIYAYGEGTSVQFTINSLLKKNSINPNRDVNIKYMGSVEEVATAAVDGEIDFCILPEPFATSVVYKTNPEIYSTSAAEESSEADDEEQTSEPTAAAASANGMRKTLSLAKAWSESEGFEQVSGCVVARKEYIDNNPEIISEFLTFDEVSVNWINLAADAAVPLLNQGFFTDRALAEGSISGSNVKYLEGEKMEEAVGKTFDAMLEELPDLIGGSVPDSGIYYKLP